MIGKLDSLSYSMDGALIISVSVPRVHAQELQLLVGQQVDAVVKKYRKKRSVDSNALMWAVCQELASEMHITKEEVYRRAIRDVGDYVPLPIRADVVDAFCANWSVKGIGWFAEVVDDSKIPGYKLVFAYYGSSTYDTKQMSRLLDHLVDDAEQIGLVLRASKELEQRARELHVKAN